MRTAYGWGGFEPSGDVLVRFAHCARLPGFESTMTIRSSRSFVAGWVGADSNREDFASLVLWARTARRAIRSSRSFLAESHGSGRIRTADFLRVKEVS